MNDADYKEIDRVLNTAIDEGYEASKSSKSKYENDYEPGSLNFDAWAMGWNLYHSDNTDTTRLITTGIKEK